MDRQSLLVSRALVAVDAHFALNVGLYFAAQIAFEPVTLQRSRKMRQLFVVQILGTNIGIDFGLIAHLSCRRWPNAVNIAQWDASFLRVGISTQ